MGVENMMQYRRRDILKTALATIAGSAVIVPLDRAATAAPEARPSRAKLPVAGVVTVYTPNSHADVILGKILDGYRQNGGPGPDLELVSIYTDQVPEGKDLSRAIATKRGVRISPTIADALTLGTDRIQVAGVLSIGEHGDYTLTEKTQQRQYPRRRFFDEIVATFDRYGSVVPVFNDKHLGYRWQDALAMVETSRTKKFPLLAGSSVPVAWRMPPVELPRDCPIEAALTIGYGGFEDYGFHALEAHQCLLEQRRGGETGVAAVRAVTGDAVRQSEQAGDWSSALFAAALKTMPATLSDPADWQPKANSAAYLIEHRDGLRSAVIMANGLAGHFATAIKLKDRPEPIATWFKLEEVAPYGHFAYLLAAIDQMIQTQKAPYPVERTLLTTGILDRVMHSLAHDGQRHETPELAITYQAADWSYANHPDCKLKLPAGPVATQ